MITLQMYSYYFQVLSHLNLLQVLWPDHTLHAPRHSNTPKEKISTITK